jgi:hypothetical protein
MDSAIEKILADYSTDTEGASVKVAHALIELSRLRRREAHDRHSPEISFGWRYEGRLKRVEGEYKEQFYMWLYKREVNVFAFWAEELGIVHNGPRTAALALMREIGQGRIALVRFTGDEEYTSVLKFLAYVRKYFKVARRPFAEAASVLIKNLGLLRRVQFRACRPVPIAMLTQPDK